MRSLAFMVAVALSLGISACDDDSSDDTAIEETIAVDVPDVVGDTVDIATATLEAAGLTLRIVQRDGEDVPATMDLVEERVNVAVETQEDGTEVVTKVVSTG